MMIGVFVNKNMNTVHFGEQVDFFESKILLLSFLVPNTFEQSESMLKIYTPVHLKKEFVSKKLVFQSEILFPFPQS